jgi:hypothetical protein
MVNQAVGAVDFPLATVAGRSSSPIFNLHPSTPGLSAVLPGTTETYLGIFFTLSQGFNNGSVIGSDQKIYSMRYQDYEGYALEYIREWGIGQGQSFGLQVYGIAYTGGIFDDLVQNFHYFFGFPNNWRESYPQNQVMIDIPFQGSTGLQARSSQFVLGDIQFFYGLNLHSITDFNLSLRLFLNIPPPALNSLMISRQPGITPALYLNHRLFKELSWSAWAGVYLGADLLTDNEILHAGFRGALGITLELDSALSLALDLGLKTSPLLGRIANQLKYETLETANADLFFGFHWQPGQSQDHFSLLIQEDPLSHNAADISLSIGYQKLFKTTQ